MIKKVLLTGASGFIGSYISEILIQKKIDFINISNMLGNYKYPDKTVLLPLYDKERLKKTIEEFNPDAVIHMAAISSPAHKIIGEIYDVNVSGTENLLEAVKQTCRKGIRVLLFSSATVYGNQEKDYFEETYPLKPANHYSCSKAIMEYYSQNYTDCMDIRIVRPFNIIGAGQSEIFLVPKLVNAFKLQLKDIPLGNLKSVRDYVSIDFAASCVVEFLLKDNIDYPVLNICSGKGHTVQDVFDTLVKITGHKPEIKVSQDIVRHNEIWRLVGSGKRLEKIMGRQKSPDLETILKKMLNENAISSNKAAIKNKQTNTKTELSSVVITRAKKPDTLIELLETLKNISDEVVVLIDNIDEKINKRLNKYADKICPIKERGSPDAFYRNIFKNCTKDWVLYIDEYQTLSDNFTKDLLKKYMIQDDMTALNIPVKWYINKNEYICTDPWYPDYRPRLFRNLKINENIPNEITKKTIKTDEIHLKEWNLLDSIEEKKDKDNYYKTLGNNGICSLYYCENNEYVVSGKEIFNYPVINNKVKAFVPKEMKAGLTYGINVLIYINNYDVINLFNNNKEIYFSYHWYNEDKTVYEWDNNRETINLTSKQQLYSSIMKIIPPKEKGNYYLQIDIVQERVQWICQIGMLNSDLLQIKIV